MVFLTVPVQLEAVKIAGDNMLQVVSATATSSQLSADTMAMPSQMDEGTQPLASLILLQVKNIIIEH